MSELFQVSELVRMAIEDEKAGVAFYTQASTNARSDELRRLLADLAGQERFHQKRFEDMLEAMGGHKTHEEYPGQYRGYLEALTSGRAFPTVEAAQQQAKLIKSDLEAVNVALRFERDTLLLMNEMRSLVPQKDQMVVDELIREEQSHLVSLSDARRALGK